jgi:hypothetical protein
MSSIYLQKSIVNTKHERKNKKKRRRKKTDNEYKRMIESKRMTEINVLVYSRAWRGRKRTLLKSKEKAAVKQEKKK